MEREIGVERADLPHEFAADENGRCVVCHEIAENELHVTQAQMLETAADAGPALVTEKGS